MRSRLLALITTLSLSCRGTEPPPDAGDAAVDAALEPDAGAPGCPGSLDPVVCSGTVDPTTLGADEVLTGLTGGAPGLHWFCAPGDGVPWNGRVVLYLVGTYSDPRTEHAVALRACELGFVAVAPMYTNRWFPRDACGDVGACLDGYHVEIVDGREAAPDPIAVGVDDSIRGRVAALLQHLAARGEPWSTVERRLRAGDWSSVALVGHSQGSGHVTYLARDERAERVVLLAGPAGRIASGTPAHAPVPWIAALETMPLSTTLRLSYIHDDDSFQIVEQVIDNWDLIGVPDTTCPHTSEATYLPGCRRIRAASAGCTGLNAHFTPVLARWGPTCAAGAGHENRATWDHLLLAE